MVLTMVVGAAPAVMRELTEKRFDANDA